MLEFYDSGYFNVTDFVTDSSLINDWKKNFKSPINIKILKMKNILDILL